jgi:hypothetical protein
MEAGRHRQRRSHNQGVGAEPVCAIALRIRLRQRGSRISPFPVSPSGGKPGRGGFPPRRRQAARQCRGCGGGWQGNSGEALARIPQAAPPTRGVSKRFAETPLVHPPVTRKLYGLRQQGRRFFYLTMTGLLMEARNTGPVARLHYSADYTRVAFRATLR